MASEREERAESWVGAATAAVTRTKAASGQSPEGTRTAWVEASVGEASRAAVGALGAEAQVSGMASAVMGTTEAVTIL